MDESFLEEFVDDDHQTKEVKKTESSGKKSKSAAVKSSQFKKSSVKKTAAKDGVKGTEKKSDEEKHPRMEGKSIIVENIIDNVENKKEAKKETVEIRPAKEKVPIETSKPVDPWADEKKDSGLFTEVSTWKAITGVVLILLIFSIFTQGFRFSEQASMGVTGAGAAAISLSEAETKAVDYVNKYLLPSPFQAQVASSVELDNLYKVTLTVAGREIDSYLTKDGQLFFPQGFDLTKSASLMPAESLDGQLTENNTLSGLEKLENNSTGPSVAEEITDERPVDDVDNVAGEVVLIEINAKKWMFEPNKINVNKGDVVSIKINPLDLDFTFAIPEYGIEEKVSGVTEIKFAANKAGTFGFKCSNCEDWRGMSGTIVVE